MRGVEELGPGAVTFLRSSSLSHHTTCGPGLGILAVPQPNLEDGTSYHPLRSTEVLQFILTRANFPSGLGQLRSGCGSGVRCLACAPRLFPGVNLLLSSDYVPLSESENVTLAKPRRSMMRP